MATKKKPIDVEDIRESFVARFSNVLGRLSQTVSPTVLVRALKTPDDIKGLTAALSESLEIRGESYRLTRARLRSLEIKEKLVEEAGGVLSVSQVAELLNVKPESIHQRRRRGTLLALRSPNGRWVYPAFQFKPIEIASEIGKVLSAFKVDDPWVQLSLLLSKAPSLGYKSPIEALRDGDLEGAQEAAASYGLQDQMELASA